MQKTKKKFTVGLISAWQTFRMAIVLGLGLSLVGCYPRHVVVAIVANKNLNTNLQSQPLSMVVTIFELSSGVKLRGKDRIGWGHLVQKPVVHQRVKSFVLIPGEIRQEKFKISRDVSRVVVKGAYYLEHLKKQKVLIKLKRGLPFRTLHYQIKADNRGMSILTNNRGGN